MNKQDLIGVVAEAGAMPRVKAVEVVDALFGAIESALRKNEEVRLVGFGTFAVSRRKAGKVRNPRTGEDIEVPESNTVRFKPGKGLRGGLNGAEGT